MKAGWLVMIALLLAPTLAAAGGDARAVPAEFIRELTLPGSDHFLRPAAICVDRNFDEVLIADAGNNRIVIFDTEGVYRHDFSCAGYFSSPLHVDVDSQGFIYVCGGTSAGRLLCRFDFDGQFLGEVSLDATPDGKGVDIGGMTLDEDNRLLILDKRQQRICVYDLDGRFETSFHPLADMELERRNEQIFGDLLASGGRIYLPVPTLGSVLVLDRTGALIHSIGYQGNNVGELNFPVAVALSAAGEVLVLDKHRFNVVCFDAHGKFIGEFGGKGVSPGWFFQPTLLEVDRSGQAYIGQIFENKVQVCGLPAFLARAAKTEEQLGDQSLATQLLINREEKKQEKLMQKEATPEQTQFGIPQHSNLNSFVQHLAMLGGL
jgi:hypothetical protein